MKFIADLHIHSHYSMATSKLLVPEYLDYWAGIKGIRVLGSGDFTHPGWIDELEEALSPAEEGFFVLKDERKQAFLSDLTARTERSVFIPPGSEATRFVLSAEISTIYKKHGRVRKVHSVILVSRFEHARAISRRLGAIGNITSDGRPILGLDAKDLLAITLEAAPDAIFIPAHVWTPWFSVLGAKSGFDSIQECFEDLTPEIPAIETGLSSDPPMNWICSSLDKFAILSNSDAHSPENLGREANVFDTELSYPGIRGGLRGEGLVETVEFFPQEGKYHYDGHRKCGVRWDPLETVRNDGVCPRCGKPVVVGVMNRVTRLADRPGRWNGEGTASNARPFRSLIPLKELLSEILGVGKGSKAVATAYAGVLGHGVGEIRFLSELSLEEVERAGGRRLAVAVDRMRRRRVYVDEGYDGEYGTVTVFGGHPPQEQPAVMDGGLFDGGVGGEVDPAALPDDGPEAPPRPLIAFDPTLISRSEGPGGNVDADLQGQGIPEPVDPLAGGNHTIQPDLFAGGPATPPGIPDPLAGLNPDQRRAAGHEGAAALVIAGPGTGKTRTLVARIVTLISNGAVLPAEILAVTFTNKAAEEMKDRLAAALPASGCRGVTVCTFHALGAAILREFPLEAGLRDGFSILDEDGKVQLLTGELGLSSREAARMSEKIALRKRRYVDDETPRESLQGAAAEADAADAETEAKITAVERQFRQILMGINAVDMEDLLYLPCRLLSRNPKVTGILRARYRHVLIDEFQDIDPAQLRIVLSLSPPPGKGLYVIGDPSQAIYGFRGADPRFIRLFGELYPGAVTYDLRRSYRCTETILSVSRQVLAGGEGEYRVSGTQGGPPAQLSEHSSERSEAEYIARLVEAMIGGTRFFSMDSDVTAGYDDTSSHIFSDFAVLARTRRQLGPVAKAFRDHGIPIRYPGERLDAEGVAVSGAMDILAYSLNPGNAFLGKRLRRLSGEGQFPVPARAIDGLGIDGYPGGTVERFFAQVFESMPDDWLSAHSTDVKAIQAAASAYGSDPESFLFARALREPLDEYDLKEDAVSLLTMHASKGLEFECVLIAGCEDGLIPYTLFSGEDAVSPDRIEEERRLFYVGITRAKRSLHLTWARRRKLFGTVRALPRSPFLQDIERELTERSDPRYTRRQSPDQKQLRFF